MPVSAGTNRRWRLEALLAATMLVLANLPAFSDPLPAVDAGLAARLGIAIFPGAELIAFEGPAVEVVDLERPGWSFVEAEVLTADFLIAEPIGRLRHYYRPLTVRDRKLLLRGSDTADGVVVSVRYTGRHPLHPRRRWLRIVTYRLVGPPGDPPPEKGHLEGR